MRRGQGRDLLTGRAPRDSPRRGRKAVFTFATTHQAMAAEDLLREAGFRLEVVPPPRELSAGCGLAVQVSLDDLAAAMGRLRSRGAVWEAVHRLGPAREVVEKLG